jgi:hypothetical protein
MSPDLASLLVCGRVQGVPSVGERNFSQ